MPRHFADVQPLVTARALQPCLHVLRPRRTWRRAPSSPSASAGRGGAAWSSPPPTRRRAGIDPADVESVVEQLPPALVDLALWIAEYYGSTAGRALALVAPHVRKRRFEKPSPVARESLPGAASRRPSRHEPQRAAGARIIEALDGGGGHFLLYGATGSGKTEVYLPRLRGGARPRPRRDRARPGDRARRRRRLTRFTARFGDRVAVCTRRSPRAERRDERERVASGEARVVVGARSAIFAPGRATSASSASTRSTTPSYKQEADPRYDARTVAAKRAALEKGGGRLRERDAAARELGDARAARARRTDRRRAAAGQVVDLRREPGYPLSAPLIAGLDRSSTRRRQGDPAAQPARRRPGDPLPGLRHDPALPSNCDIALVLHADGQLHCHHCSAVQPALEHCPDAARRSWPGSAPGRSGSSVSWPSSSRAGADPARRRRRGQARRARRRARPLRRDRPRGAARDADGRQGPRLRRRRARRGRRCRHRDGAARLPRRGAHVPADHPARRTERAGRARPRPRPDLPAGLARRRVRRAPRRRALYGAASWSGGASSATRRSAT